MPLPPELPPRPPRDPPLRGLAPRERVVLERDDFAAPDGLRAAGLRVAPAFAADEREDPLPDDLARLAVVFLPLPVERGLAAVLRDAPAVERFAVVRFAVVRFAPEVARALLDRPELLREEPELERAEVPELALPLLPELSPTFHLPDITRCAASATASAMIEPSFVALETTLLAARSAVSAASRPASRIFFRAAGLALIAAAAAARPAASISLLIAALASLSIVSLFERERDELEPALDDEERDELLRADFAIFYLPRSPTRHFKAVPVPE